MNIKIFLASAINAYEKELLLAFGAGLEKTIEKRQNDDQYKNLPPSVYVNDLSLEEYSLSCSYAYDEEYSDCDVAVIFGSWKNREKSSHTTRNSIVKQAKKFVVIETPLLNRSTSETNTSWRVGINGYLCGSATWAKLDSEQAQKRLNTHGIQWQGWKNNPNGHIVVALQLPGDASLRGQDIDEWAYHTIKKIRKHSSKKIIIRTHPLASERAINGHFSMFGRLCYENIKNIQMHFGNEVSWFDDLNDAYCTVTYSSGLGIDSVMAGIPTVACDSGSFAYTISTNTVADIEQVSRADDETIQQWLELLIACQFSETEIASGLAWECLEPMLLEKGKKRASK